MKCKCLKCDCLKGAVQKSKATAEKAVENSKAKAEQLAADYKEGNVTGRELVLSGLVLFLAGIVIGMILSPRKVSMLGCNNGNNTVVPAEEEEE